MAEREQEMARPGWLILNREEADNLFNCYLKTVRLKEQQDGCRYSRRSGGLLQFGKGMRILSPEHVVEERNVRMAENSNMYRLAVA